MSTLETITTLDLANVTGGATQKQMVCNRAQYDWMAAHMVSDSSRQPGVQRHVIAHDSKMCGFPMPAAR